MKKLDNLWAAVVKAEGKKVSISMGNGREFGRILVEKLAQNFDAWELLCKAVVEKRLTNKASTFKVVLVRKKAKAKKRKKK